MQGSGSNFKSLTQSLHHFPQLPPRFSGGSRNGHRHPRGQTASAVSGPEIGGPSHDISGPAQGL